MTAHSAARRWWGSLPVLGMAVLALAGGVAGPASADGSATLLVVRGPGGAARAEERRVERQLSRAFGEVQLDVEAWMDAQGAAPPPLALRPLAQVEALLSRAREQATNLAEGEALASLAEAQRLVEQVLWLEGAAAWNAEVQVRIGLVAAQAGQAALAEQALRRAVVLDPRRQIGAAEAAPDTVALAERLRQEVATAPRGSFQVISEPAGAQVYWDDRALGRTPLSVSTPTGRHLLRLTLPEHSPVGAFVDVLEGSRAAVRVALAPSSQALQARRLVSAARGGDYARLPSLMAPLASRGALARLFVVELGTPADRAVLTVCLPSVCRGPSRMLIGTHHVIPTDRPLSAESLADARAWLEERVPGPPRESPVPLWERWYVWSAGLGLATAVTLAIVLGQAQEPERSLRLVVDPSGVGQ